MPVNKAFSVEKLINSAKYYFNKTGRRVVFEYAMIKGVNDREQDAKRLGEILSGFPTHLNLIPLNYVKEHNALVPTDKAGIYKFMEKLESLGVSVTKRRTMGEDVAGACGQLRRRFLEDKNHWIV